MKNTQSGAMRQLAIWSPRPNAKMHESVAPNITLHGLPVMRIVCQAAQSLYVSEKPSNDIIPALDGFIFTSQNAVECALSSTGARDYFEKKPRIAIGGRTEQDLLAYDLPATLTAPAPYNSEALLNDKCFQSLSCKHVGIVCGVGGRTFLQNELNKANISVTRIECYRRDKIHLSSQIMIEFIDNYVIGGIILSSSEIAESVASQLERTNLRRCFRLPVFVFGARNAVYAESLGFEHVVIVEQASQYFLYQRIINWWERYEQQ